MTAPMTAAEIKELRDYIDRHVNARPRCLPVDMIQTFRKAVRAIDELTMFNESQREDIEWLRGPTE